MTYARLAERTRDVGQSVRIGVLVPLTRPGWTEAGQHLLAGLELSVRHTNEAGGIADRPVELVVRDTAADPTKAEAAVEELAQLGVAALAGEYHSVVARAAAVRAEALGIPFLCSSAVLDTLIEEPSRWVARLAPAQSHAWRIYAEFLAKAGHRHVAAAVQPSVYWQAGTRILRRHLTRLQGSVIELDANALPVDSICDRLHESRASALLILTGYPEPAVQLVRAVRGDARLTEVMIGAPAGQPEFADWKLALGREGGAIPFLRYLTEHVPPLGQRVRTALQEQLGEPPSFVAFEGYDTGLVLSDLLRSSRLDRTSDASQWSHVAVQGTRGLVKFSQQPDIGVWQWRWAPVQVVDRDPSYLDRFRILRAEERA